MDYALTLEQLRPGARYAGSLTANTPEAYAALRWKDERPKPTPAEIAAAEVEIARAKRKRQAEARTAELLTVTHNGAQFQLSAERVTILEAATKRKDQLSYAGKGKGLKTSSGDFYFVANAAELQALNDEAAIRYETVMAGEAYLFGLFDDAITTAALEAITDDRQ